MVARERLESTVCVSVAVPSQRMAIGERRLEQKRTILSIQSRGHGSRILSNYVELSVLKQEMDDQSCRKQVGLGRSSKWSTNKMAVEWKDERGSIAEMLGEQGTIDISLCLEW
jgi:hypothetical protein